MNITAEEKLMYEAVRQYVNALLPHDSMTD